MANEVTSRESATTKGLPWWAEPIDVLLVRLKTSELGLSSTDAELRHGPTVGALRSASYRNWMLLLSQFKSPIILILIATSLLSFVLNDRVDSVTILAIICASVLLGFFQGVGSSSLFVLPF